MKDVIYITGNQKKADYLAKYLGHPVIHQKMDLDEIQSLDLKKIVRHKLMQAYGIAKKPVLVEDTTLGFNVWKGLPGPFIKYFGEQMTLSELCALLDGKDRGASATCMFGYFDGEREEYFEGRIDGTISEKPKGDSGFGFNSIFIPRGFGGTMSELSEEDYKTAYLKLKPIKQIAEFLSS